MSAGIVIPGVSQTVILMFFGMYGVYLDSVSGLDFSVLIPMGAGAALGGLMFLSIIHFLFKYLKSYTYFAIIGFVLGSVFILFPRFHLWF